MVVLIRLGRFEQFFADLADCLARTEGQPDRGVALQIIERYGGDDGDGVP